MPLVQSCEFLLCILYRIHLRKPHGTTGTCTTTFNFAFSICYNTPLKKNKNMPKSPDKNPYFPPNCDICKNMRPYPWTGLPYEVLLTCRNMPPKGSLEETPCMNPKTGAQAFTRGTGHPRPTTQTENTRPGGSGVRRTSGKRMGD